MLARPLRRISLAVFLTLAVTVSVLTTAGASPAPAKTLTLAVTVPRLSLGASGGSETIVVGVVGSTSCRLSIVSHPSLKVKTGKLSTPCATGHYRVAVHISANQTSVRRVVRFRVEAISGHRRVTRVISIVVAAKRKSSAPAPTSTTTTTTVPASVLTVSASPSTPSTCAIAIDQHLCPNWAGYQWDAPSGTTMSMVSGAWAVPTLNCSALPTSIVYDFIGIGGVSASAAPSSPYFQSGTIEECQGGQQTSFSFWTDDALGGVPQVGMAVAAGDLITDEQIPQLGVWGYTLTDYPATTGVDRYVVGGPGPLDGSPTTAEWVAEDPGGTTPQTLADYGSTTFGLLETCDSGQSDCALVPATADQLTPMQAYSPSGALEVTPSSVSTGVKIGAFGPGDAFTDTYNG
jgi:hypothetical protein